MRYDECQRHKRMLRVQRLLNVNMFLALIATLGALVSAYREGQLKLRPPADTIRIVTPVETVQVAGVGRVAGVRSPFVEQAAFDSLRREVADLARALSS